MEALSHGGRGLVACLVAAPARQTGYLLKHVMRHLLTRDKRPTDTRKEAIVGKKALLRIVADTNYARSSQQPQRTRARARQRSLSRALSASFPQRTVVAASCDTSEKTHGESSAGRSRVSPPLFAHPPYLPLPPSLLLASVLRGRGRAFDQTSTGQLKHQLRPPARLQTSAKGRDHEPPRDVEGALGGLAAR